MINADNVNAQTAGSVICTLEQVKILGWVPNKSQPMMPTKSGRFVCGNRVAFQDGEKWFVKGKKNARVEVRKTGENRYIVI